MSKPTMPNDNVLTEQIRAVCNAHVVTMGDDFALGADRLAKRILALLADHPGQPEPRVAGAIPRVHGVRRFPDNPCTVLVMLMAEATDDALRAIHDRLTCQPEPRAEVTHGDTTMGECMASLLDRLEVAELYADRYRYLRERPLDAVSTGGVFAGKTPDNVVLNGADLDAAIDAAMKEVN